VRSPLTEVLFKFAVEINVHTYLLVFYLLRPQASVIYKAHNIVSFQNIVNCQIAHASLARFIRGCSYLHDRLSLPVLLYHLPSKYQAFRLQQSLI